MASTPTHVDIRLSAELTVIRPGDTVIIRVPANIPTAQAQHIAEHLRDRLPDVADILVLAGTDGLEVYRPGKE